MADSTKKTIWLKLEIARIFISLKICKNNKQNKLHLSIIKSFPYLTLGTSPKTCGKLILRKLLLRDATQLKAAYLYKTTKSQSACESGRNLKFHKNAISKSLF